MINTQQNNSKQDLSRPIISVLMPAYNTGTFIQESIQSIIDQNFTDWELIIIDDCSTDNTPQIIDSYIDPRIHCYRNAKNMGLIASLNKGIEICQGKYIVRLDSDDIASPNRLKIQFEYMELHSETVMCGSNALIIDKIGNKIGLISNFKENSLLQINLLFTVPFIHPSMCLRADVLKQNLYDKDYIYAEDYELWVRLSKLGKIYNIQEKLLLYRWHEQNTSIIHQQKQDETKNKIIVEQLKRFGIDPSIEEINIHRSLFDIFRFGHKNKDFAPNLPQTKKWFKKLETQNRQNGIYSQNDLIAFLWSRWIILCLIKKNYIKSVNPGLRINPIIICRTLSIILFLRKKSWKPKKN